MSRTIIITKSPSPKPEDKPKMDKPPEVLASDIAFSELLERAKQILNRDMYYLNQKSLDGKLDKDGTLCLRDYIRLLNDLTKQEKGLAEALSTEQLEKIVNGSENK